MGQYEQKLLLCRGVDAWNQWRRDNPAVIPDLSFCVLEGTNLSGADLSEADLYCAWLAGANLAAADLNGADLSGASLAGADLSDADLSGGLSLTQAQINEAHGNDGTRLPEGLRRPERWTKRPSGTAGS
ncbi:MAG: pentapeptide repeat-containing protein [Rhodospirillales bacterium]